MITNNVTKKRNSYKKKTFRDIFGQPHTHEYKATKKQIMKLRWWWWWWWIIVFVVWLTDEMRFSLIYSRDHCQRSSPLQISDTLQTGFEPAQNLSSGFAEWSCVVVITTTPRLLCFLLIDWLSFEEGKGGGRVRLKLHVQRQGGGRSLDVDGQGGRGWKVLKIGQFLWTSYVYNPLWYQRKTFAISAWGNNFYNFLIYFPY